jgi:diguanylate cyclase (GGDEF)-like protein
MASRPTTSSSIAFVVALCLVCAIGYVDVVTGYEINLGLFYLIPVALATWRSGLVVGLLLSVVSVVGMFIVDNFVTRDIPFPSNALIPYWNTGIRLGYFVIVATMLAALKRAHDRERRYARQDSLTGVANSQNFEEALHIEIERARRHPRPISVAYMDCDNFKQINDQFGHHTGNEVLKSVATTLTERLRESDVVARLGGDEFAVLLPETSAQAASDLVESLRAALLDRMCQNRWPVTFSIGVVTFITPPESSETAMRLSDDLMYEAKRNGKDMVSHQVVDQRNGRR